MKSCLAILVVLAATCDNNRRDPPSPSPLDPPNTDDCAAMCDHLEALGCEEGQPVYDSDVEGPVDVPNTSCEEFCRRSQQRGAFLNPRCVSTVLTCSQIEDYRSRDPETCTVR